MEVHCKNAPAAHAHVTVLVAHVTEPQLEKAKAVMEETLKKKILPQISEEFKISFDTRSRDVIYDVTGMCGMCDVTVFKQAEYTNL